MSQLKKQKLGILGLGKMGGLLLEALLRQKVVGSRQVFATVHHPERAEKLQQQFSVPVSTDNRKLAQESDVILLGVKPNVVAEVVREIAPFLTPQKLLISIAASVPTSFIEQLLDSEIPVVRAMPNTPCTVACGMTGICGGTFAGPAHLELTRKVFESVGRTVTVDEKHMDAVTGLSASGPAFIYIILESLAEAGVKVGLPRDVATLLAAQTVHGAAKVVLETGSHPALLKDAVTTPAGCTIDGVMELEEGKLRVTLIKAVVKATERARELLLSGQ